MQTLLEHKYTSKLSLLAATVKQNRAGDVLARLAKSISHIISNVVHYIHQICQAIKVTRFTTHVSVKKYLVTFDLSQ